MGNICVIGRRCAGATTYLAALAYCSEINCRFYEITCLTNDAEKLRRMAEEIILQGCSLRPTEIDGVKVKSADDLPLYSFKMKIKHWPMQLEEIDIIIRDYAGELFEVLASGIINSVHQEFMDALFVKDRVGCLILLDRLEKESDSFYQKCLTKLIDLMESHDRTEDFRVAVAISKCDRGELWTGRLHPETDLFRLHLPRTTKTLRSRIPSINLQFFAISAYGVLQRNDPRPNKCDELGTSLSVLRVGKKWTPYGIIQPLYWLSKGKMLKR